MRKLVIISSIVILPIVILIVGLAIILLVTEPHWTLEDVVDKNPRKLPASHVYGALDAYEMAKERVDEWREGTYLHRIMVDFQGNEQIHERKGLIRYSFYIHNNDNDGYPHVRAVVDIDTINQEIIRFEAFGGFDLTSRKLDIDGWLIDSTQALEIVEEYMGTDFYRKYPSPMVRIRANYDRTWGVEFHVNEKSHTPEKYVTVNALTGRVEE